MHPPALAVQQGQANLEQRRLGQVEPLRTVLLAEGSVVLPPRLLWQVAIVGQGYVQPDGRVDHLHRPAQPLPADTGAQGVVAIDQRLPGGAQGDDVEGAAIGERELLEMDRGLMVTG